MRKEIETRTVREVMTRHPVTVSPDMSIRELKALFETHDFNMFPVVDKQGVFRGIVTKLDLLRTFRPQLRRWIPDLRVLWAERVEGIMNRGAIIAEPDDSIVVVVDTMLESRLRSLPVVERRGGSVIVGPLAAGANTRRRGEDVQAGAVVLQAGGVLRPQEIGVAASLGLAQLLVRRKPRVAILSTGDEVAEPGSVRKPGQIYDSNRFSLRGLVESAGASAVDDGIVPDQFDELHARLLRAAEHADVVLTSGGVSVGDYDLVKAVLQQAGGIDFWQVAMQPGRPLAVGSIGRAHFFGLPGNPVASMLTFHLFVRPALWKLAGRRELFVQPFRATAVEPMRKKAGRREFKRGILTYAGDRWEVRTTGPQGSGILSSMTAANCFVVIEEERGDVAAGEPVWVEPFQPL